MFLKVILSWRALSSFQRRSEVVEPDKFPRPSSCVFPVGLSVAGRIACLTQACVVLGNWKGKWLCVFTLRVVGVFVDCRVNVVVVDEIVVFDGSILFEAVALESVYDWVAILR